MFSRYKKPQMDTAKPVDGMPGGTPGAARVVAKSELTGSAAPKSKPIVQTAQADPTVAAANPPVKSRPVTKTVGETPSDKELKRRQRL